MKLFKSFFVFLLLSCFCLLAMEKPSQVVPNKRLPSLVWLTQKALARFGQINIDSLPVELKAMIHLLRSTNGNLEKALFEVIEKRHQLELDKKSLLTQMQSIGCPFNTTAIDVAQLELSSLIEKLIKQGADLKAKDVNGDTPFELAQIVEDDAAQASIQAHAPNPSLLVRRNW